MRWCRGCREAVPAGCPIGPSQGFIGIGKRPRPAPRRARAPRRVAPLRGDRERRATTRARIRNSRPLVAARPRPHAGCRALAAPRPRSSTSIASRPTASRRRPRAPSPSAAGEASRCGRAVEEKVRGRTRRSTAAYRAPSETCSSTPRARAPSPRARGAFSHASPLAAACSGRTGTRIAIGAADGLSAARG